MASTETSTARRRREREGFDVIVEQVIGHVGYDPKSDLSPVEAAFLMIARHGDPGTFRFPLGYEDATLKVEVTAEYPAGHPAHNGDRAEPA